METVLRSFGYSLRYLHDQVGDLEDHDLVAQPAGILNHPAWTIGHLAMSCQAIDGEIGLAEWLPADWKSLYGTGSLPVPDVEKYGTKAELLRTLGDSERRVVEAVARLPAKQLDQPLPDARFRDVLPSLRDAITQILVAHTANHVGQVTVWRRCMGLPPVSTPFL